MLRAIIGHKRTNEIAKSRANGFSCHSEIFIGMSLRIEVDFCPVLCITEVPVLQAFRDISHFGWYCKAVSDLS